MAADECGAFSVLSYNILARSLGSSCIPWVIQCPDEMDALVLSETGKELRAWIRDEFSPAYLKFFHRNYESGDKDEMRALWSSALESAADIPASLTRVEYVAPDVVLVPLPGSGEPSEAMTMRGLLRKHVPKSANVVYASLMEAERFRRWQHRGPLIYNTILSQNPDIVVLTEYDVHGSRAAYRGQGAEETFAEAMLAAGFSGVFFCGLEKRSLSGIGMWWRSAAFTCSAVECGGGNAPTVFCDEPVSDELGNYDMHEHCHKRLADGTYSASPEEMDIAERRHVCLARLRHVPSGRALLLVGAHLMTDTRDCAKTNRYPGEVRAGEIAAIRRRVLLSLLPFDDVVLTGDFNTHLVPDHAETHVLLGQAGPAVIDTGIIAEGIDYVARWGPLELREAFAPTHRWGAAVGSGDDGVCTSFSAGRCTWIDLMWHSAGLAVVQTCGYRTPSAHIPDETHGSDHLPISAVLRFVPKH